MGNLDILQMKEHQLDAFKIFYDMIFNSIFDSKEIETERDVIKEEYITKLLHFMF